MASWLIDWMHVQVKLMLQLIERLVQGIYVAGNLSQPCRDIQQWYPTNANVHLQVNWVQVSLDRYRTRKMGQQWGWSSECRLEKDEIYFWWRRDWRNDKRKRVRCAGRPACCVMHSALGNCVMWHICFWKLEVPWLPSAKCTTLSSIHGPQVPPRCWTKGVFWLKVCDIMKHHIE